MTSILVELIQVIRVSFSTDHLFVLNRKFKVDNIQGHCWPLFVADDVVDLLKQLFDLITIVATCNLALLGSLFSETSVLVCNM